MILIENHLIINNKMLLHCKYKEKVIIIKEIKSIIAMFI